MTPRNKALRLAKRLFFRMHHKYSKPHEIECLNGKARLRVNSTNRISEDLYSDSFEKHQRRILSAVLKRDHSFFDVGANIGFYTCMIALELLRPNAVLAIEPSPEIFQQLTNNIKINSLDGMVVSRNVALDSTEGVKKLYQYGDDNGVYNSFSCQSAIGGKSATSAINVSTTTLSALSKLVDAPRDILIKIDVKGAECDVLRGGVDFLSNNNRRIVLMIELFEPAAQNMGQSVGDSVDILARCGFAPYAINGGTLVPTSKEGIISNRGQMCPDFYFMNKYQFDSIRKDLPA